MGCGFRLWIGCSSPANFVILFGILLVIFYSIRGALNILYLYAINHFSQQTYRVFSSRLFHRFLRFPYQDFAMRNSAVISQAIFNYSGNLKHILQGILLLSAELLTVASVYAMLFFVNNGQSCREYLLTSGFSISVKDIVEFLSNKLNGFSNRINTSKLYSSDNLNSCSKIISNRETFNFFGLNGILSQ